MYALVDIKGKQYKVEKGSIIKIDRLNSESGDKLEFDSVLLVSGEDEIQVITDKFVAEIDKVLADKEAELLEV